MRSVLVGKTITLYDLTNTFFEGTASGNAKAQRGHSKEKRSDCPLVTLALVLDASGFPKRSEVFAGNASEPATLKQMLQRLALAPGAVAPTVVLDAGIATEENLAWLREQGYRYLVVSRERHKQFDPDQAIVIRDEGATRIRAQRVVDEDSGEVRLYCHSTGREAKERGIAQRFSTRLEAELNYLAEGLHLPRRVKHYDKVLTRIGRLRQRYSRVARYYDIRLEKVGESEKFVVNYCWRQAGARAWAALRMRGRWHWEQCALWWVVVSECAASAPRRSAWWAKSL